jgi:hypothetical protein
MIFYRNQWRRDFLFGRRPLLGHGKMEAVLFDFKLINNANPWRPSKGRFVVFVSRLQLEHFKRLEETRPKRLPELGETILIENGQVE